MAEEKRGTLDILGGWTKDFGGWAKDKWERGGVLLEENPEIGAYGAVAGVGMAMMVAGSAVSKVPLIGGLLGGAMRILGGLAMLVGSFNILATAMGWNQSKDENALGLETGAGKTRDKNVVTGVDLGSAGRAYDDVIVAKEIVATEVKQAERALNDAIAEGTGVSDDMLVFSNRLHRISERARAGELSEAELVQAHEVALKIADSDDPLAAVQQMREQGIMSGAMQRYVDKQKELLSVDPGKPASVNGAMETLMGGKRTITPQGVDPLGLGIAMDSSSYVYHSFSRGAATGGRTAPAGAPEETPAVPKTGGSASIDMDAEVLRMDDVYATYAMREGYVRDGITALRATAAGFSDADSAPGTERDKVYILNWANRIESQLGANAPASQAALQQANVVIHTLIENKHNPEGAIAELRRSSGGAVSYAFRSYASDVAEAGKIGTLTGVGDTRLWTTRDADPLQLNIPLDSPAAIRRYVNETYSNEAAFSRAAEEARAGGVDREMLNPDREAGADMSGKGADVVPLRSRDGR